MTDKLTQKDLNLLKKWGACEESIEYRKVGQSLSEIPEDYRDWAIRRASKYGHLDIVNRLLKAGVNQWGISEEFLQAVQKSHFGIVERFLEFGVNHDTIINTLKSSIGFLKSV